MPRRPHPLTLLVAMAAAVMSLVYAWREGRDAAGLDFYQFWAGAQVARWPATGDLYSPLTRATAYRIFQERAAKESPRMATIAALRTEFEFFSTPFLYTVFGVFSGDYDRDFDAYRVLSLASFVGGVLLLARAAAMGWPAALWLLAFTLTLFQPFKSEIRVANVNSLQLVMIGGAAWLLTRARRGSWFAGGVLLGLVCAFKPNIAIVIPLLFVYRLRDRARLIAETAGAAAGAAIAVVVSGLYFRSFESWLQWLGAARGLAKTLLPLSSGNVAPSLLAAGALGPRASAILAIGLLVAFGFVVWRTAVRDPVMVIGLGLLIYLLAATLVWLHYLVLALPLVVAVLADDSAVRRAAGVLALTLVGGDVWTTLLTVKTAAGEAAVLWSGLAILGVVAVWRLATRSVSLSAP